MSGRPIKRTLRGTTATTRWSRSRTLGSGVTSRNRIAGGTTGKGRRRHARRCMPIVGGFGAPAGNGCCANAVNGSNAPMRISTKPGASARASQHPEACARAYLRLQSRVAHAAADGDWHTAEPPRPRGGRVRRPDGLS